MRHIAAQGLRRFRSSSRKSLAAASAGGVGVPILRLFPLSFPDLKSKVSYSWSAVLDTVFSTKTNLEGEVEVSLDPNRLSEDGMVALSSAAISKDGRYLAYVLSSSGSDCVTIKVMWVEDKTVEPDTLSWVNFPRISWAHDEKGEGGDLDAGLRRILIWIMRRTTICWGRISRRIYYAGGILRI